MSAPIVGGVAVDGATYSATGALVEWLPTGAPLLVCTATLIAPRVVLTAGHCVADSGSRLPDFTTLANIADATPANSHHGRRAVVHPEFNPQATGSVHDIALVELDTAVDGVSVERLLDSRDAGTVIAIGDRLELVGYGVAMMDGGLGGQRTAAMAEISSVGTNEIVLGGPGKVQDCVGDSGGPSFRLGSDGTRRIVGVTSRSANNATECVDGSIHTRVDAYTEWIGATLRTITDYSQTQSNTCAAVPARAKGGSRGFEWFAMVAVVLIVRARRRGPRAFRDDCAGGTRLVQGHAVPRRDAFAAGQELKRSNLIDTPGATPAPPDVPTAVPRSLRTEARHRETRVR